MNSTSLNKILVIAMIALAVVTAVYSYNDYQSKINKINASDSAPQVQRSLSLTDEFRSIQELRDRAELIALVSVKSTKSLTVSGVTFTLSESEIKEVFKGDAPQRVINILETGGIDGKGNMISYSDNPVFQRNDQAVVFLERYVGDVAKDAYVILGVYQGKFRVVDEDKLIPSTGVSDQLENLTSKKELLRLLNIQ
jgi:hypothetical protein